MILAWTFIIGITALDLGFALVHQNTFSTWESNGLMVWVVEHVGLWAVIMGRCIALTVLLVCITTVRPVFRQVATVLMLLVHAGLGLIYLGMVV